MNLRNAWYMVGWSKDLQPGAPFTTSVLGEPVVLHREDDGTIRAAGDGGRAYPLAERHSAIWIWMGDPARADVSRIVDFVGPDHPDWAMLPGRMDYDADYRLIQDNLLDLTHVPYVHRASFGRGDARLNDAWIRAEVHVTPLEDGVRVLRWVAGTPASPSLRQPEGTMVDALTAYEYRIPGIFLLTTRHYLAGAAARSPRDVPTDIEPLFTTFSCQAVTPLDARHTCYHFAYGPSRKHEGADGMKEGFAKLALLAFNEDKALIEAQQKVIDADPSRTMVMLDFDRSPVMYNRLVAKLMAEEAAAG